MTFDKLGIVSPYVSVDDALMRYLLADPQREKRAVLSKALLQPGSSSAKQPFEVRDVSFSRDWGAVVRGGSRLGQQLGGVFKRCSCQLFLFIFRGYS